MNRPSWLTTLMDKGSVAHSAANPKLLAELINLGIVAIKTAGIRRTLVASRPQQLRKWLDARYPDHGRVPDEAHVREGNIVRSGGSKAGNSAHGVFSFQFKWFGKEDDLWTQMTRTYGVAAALTDRLRDAAEEPGDLVRVGAVRIENGAAFLGRQRQSHHLQRLVGVSDEELALAHQHVIIARLHHLVRQHEGRSAFDLALDPIDVARHIR